MLQASAPFRWLRGVAGLLALVLVVLVMTPSVQAAEVLQVRSSSLLQVGDHNRNYTVQLACLEVPAKDEQAAVEFLRKSLPRRQRVNLRPEGSIDGTLLARVTPLGAPQDLSAALAEAGLATLSCSSSSPA